MAKNPSPASDMPGKEPWWRSPLVKMGLAKPRAQQPSAGVAAAPAAAVATDVTPAGAVIGEPASPAPAPVAPLEPESSPEPAPAPAPAPPMMVDAEGHEIVDGFEDDSTARAAAAAAAVAAVPVAAAEKSSRKAARAAQKEQKAEARRQRKEGGKAPREPKPPKAPSGRRGPLAVIVAAAKDADRRPRLIIWTGVLVLGVLIVTAVALGVTSSYWFCANGCHKVQDDTIIAYNRSVHSKVSCMACHMPVNADPATFMVHKVKALGELYMTVTNTFELPLNPESAVAATMPSEQCTQCHSDTRKITPPAGIIIDHKAHADRGITCTTCHNRVAHVEDFKLTLPGNRRHEDWMKMEACFRCHSVTQGTKGPGGFHASGECSVCHPKDFQLKPENHLIADFRVNHPTILKAKGKQYCLMCHDEKKFCNACHGVEMPHPASFSTNHGTAFKAAQAKDPNHIKLCLNCHGANGLGGMEFCNNCHHKGSDPNKPWLPQHPAAVKVQGAASCLATCHSPVFCAKCHTSGGIKASP